MAACRRGIGFGLILLVGFSCQSRAATVFKDDFESYADQKAFATSWSRNGAPPHVLDTTFGRNSSQSVKLVPQATGSGTSNRWYRNLATPVLPTDAKPVLFSFDFYLDPAGAGTIWSGDWQLVDVRAFSGGAFGAGSLNGLVAMGVAYSGASFNADTWNVRHFQGRILAPGHTSLTYYSLDALPGAVPRSSGWHTLTARIGGTQTLFSVDGVPAELVNAGITTPISTVILGSDVRSVHTFWADNISLRQVPEPDSALIVTLALSAMFQSTRRSQFRFKSPSNQI
jgi:hypothetical protein